MPVLSCALGVSVVWGGAAGYYLVFHDAVLARFMVHARALQERYETRIGELDSQLAAGAGERATLTFRLSALNERQAGLERRQAALLDLASGNGGAIAPADMGTAGDGPATTGSISTARPDTLLNPRSSPHAAPASVSATPFSSTLPTALPAAATPLSELGLRGSDLGGFVERHSARDVAAEADRMEARIEGLAARQWANLDGIAGQAGRKLARLKQMLARTGLDASRFEAAPRGIGGPLLAISGDAFAKAVSQANQTLLEVDRLRRLKFDLPLTKPLPGEVAASSGFGTRLDPFTRGLALHTGIDLPAEIGERVRATAPGKVTVAEASGGYGNMVEIDHGYGVVTRYAHLSRIDAQPGQWVGSGTIVGLAGSTGRSTGSHLHYETRIDGEPVDPQRFITLGRLLAQETARSR